MTRSSSLLFGCLLLANLALVAWWTWFQIRSTQQLEAAGNLLVAGDADGAAQALGAGSAAELPALAAARRRMFVSEGAFFAAIVLLAGGLVLAALRRQARVAADHDRFLTGATHELQTPLATIQLLLESLRDRRLPPEKQDHYLQSGLLEAARLQRGLANVLTAAGLRATGRPPARREEGDLAADVQRAVTAMQPRADAAGVALRVTALPSLPASRDAAALQLVLHNLLDNAVKHSPRGGQVQVQLGVDGADAVLSVRDHGDGMDSEELRHAFAPFWRGRNAATGGTGLGLHLVRELVAAHGGTVEARSDGPGRGSEFRVRLPRRGAVA